MSRSAEYKQEKRWKEKKSSRAQSQKEPSEEKEENAFYVFIFQTCYGILRNRHRLLLKGKD